MKKIMMEVFFEKEWKELHYVLQHIEQFFRANDNLDRNFVYLSTDSGIPHLLCYAPSIQLGRNYWTIVTYGISVTKLQLSHTLPEYFQRVELICYLPANWSFPSELGQASLNEQDWPLEILRDYGKWIRITRLWISDGHRMENRMSTPPGQPYLPTLPFTHSFLCDTGIVERKEFRLLEIDRGDERVQFYFMIPITTEEYNWVREVNPEQSLFEIIGSREMNENILIDRIVDPHRLCSVVYHHARERILALYDQLDEKEEEKKLLDYEDTYYQPH